jgi:hypothetical protein
MKTSKVMKPAIAAVLIVLLGAPVAFAGPQKQVQVVPKGERYAYVWVTGSRIPQKVKISPIGTLTQSPLSEWDRRQINQTRGGTVRQALGNEPSLNFRGP